VVLTPETSRFYELTDWLRGLGCCGMCARGMAIAAVEAGRQRYDWRAVRGECPRGCETRARRHWAERPQERRVA
jgi:hypothetical protein